VADLVPKLWANLPLILLSAALLVGATWAYRTWREAHGEGDEEPDSPEALLHEFREAYDAGELNAEEFARVRHLLVGAGPAPGPSKRSTEASRAAPNATAPRGPEGGPADASAPPAPDASPPDRAEPASD
jgi:hypothetical protein